MNRGQIRTAVRRNIREQAQSRWLDTDINAWINEGYRDLAVIARLQPAPYEFNTVSGTATYDLPSTFLSFQRVYVAGKPIKQATMPELEILAADDDGDWMSAEEEPTHFLPLSPGADGEARKIRLYPEPDDVYAVTVWRGVLPAELSADSHTPLIDEAYHPAIVMYATSMAWDHVQEYNVAAEYLSRYDAKREEYEIVASANRTDLPRKMKVSR